MRDRFLAFSPPLIGDQEIEEVIDTLRSDWITTGPKVRRFEQEFAAFLGAPDALAVSSCTAALHLALLVLGVGPGDGVVTSPLTFCSGANVIEHVGARPILADIEPTTLNIDVEQTRRAVEDAKSRYGVTVKAIMPVHLYGHPCDRAAILALAKEHGLAVIEDAAHALPARYQGARIGSDPGTANTPVLTCFSFYATKNLTTAEGGMLTGSTELLDRARIWALHGMNRDAWKRYGSQGAWFYEIVCPGYKYNMTDLQASLGLRQLSKLSAFHARRKEIVTKYNSTFSQCVGVQTPTERIDVEHAWHLYVLRIDGNEAKVSRDEVIAHLRRDNIGSSVHFIPIHLHKYYRDKYDYKPQDFPVALRSYEQIVSLPLSPRMSDEDVEDVIRSASSVLGCGDQPNHVGAEIAGV